MHVLHLLLVAVLQFCIQKVQRDGLPEVNDLSGRQEQCQASLHGNSTHLRAAKHVNSLWAAGWDAAARNRLGR